MHFKEWLNLQEIAVDSWGTPTAQPVARIYANYGGSALDGVLLPNSLPVDHRKQANVKELLQKQLKKFEKRNAANSGNYKSSDGQGDLWAAFSQQYKKLRPRLPRPQNYNDAPDQYTTSGFDAIGTPDTGQKTTFRPLTFFR